MVDEKLDHFISVLHRETNDLVTDEELNLVRKMINSQGESFEKLYFDEEIKEIIYDIKSNFNMFIKILKNYNKKTLNDEELIKLCKYVPLRKYNVPLALFLIKARYGEELFKNYFDTVCFYTKEIGDFNHLKNFHLFVDNIRKYHINCERETYEKIIKYPEDLSLIKDEFKNEFYNLNNEETKSELLQKYAEYMTYMYLKQNLEKKGGKELLDSLIWVSKEAGDFFTYSFYFQNNKHEANYMLVKPALFNENNPDNLTFKDKEQLLINDMIEKKLNLIIAKVNVYENGNCCISLLNRLHNDYISSDYSTDIYIKNRDNIYTRKKYN